MLGTEIKFVDKNRAKNYKTIKNWALGVKSSDFHIGKITITSDRGLEVWFFPSVYATYDIYLK